MNINAITAPETLEETSIEVRPCEPGEAVALQEIFPGFTAEPAGTTLIAWSDGIAVGHVQVRWRGSVHSFVRAHFPKMPEIRRLRVRNDVRGQGVAKKLLSAAEDLATSRGHRHVGLAVGIDNAAAIGLYDNFGYTVSELPSFHSSMGLDDQGNRYTHVVQYMRKGLTKPARSLVVA